MLDTSSISIGSVAKPVLEGFKVVADLQWLIDSCEQRLMTDTMKWAMEILAFCPDSWISDYELSERISVPQVSSRVCISNRLLHLGRSLILTRDFNRASFFLKEVKNQGEIHMFLYYWSRYLACIRTRMENDVESIDRRATGRETDDTDIVNLLQEMYKERKTCDFDVFLKYLQGKVEEAIGMRTEAKASLLEALRVDRRLWPAWQDLVPLLSNAEEIEFCAQLGANADGSAQWMCDWFASLALARFHFDRHAIKKSEVLVARGMTGIPMIMTQIAACSNHIHEHDTTLEMFKRIREMDPFRIDHMNLYSDSLYIRGERVLLADLAHTFFKTHKFTWETCCIVGNYYGMRRENEQAIRFFQRALRLNPGVASIWVLIGHEFMELKNNSAACMSYRKAIEVDESDYRGWYGLGQLYDILKMQSYSLYYYQQAHKCKPQDSRMLVALGEVYTKMGRYRAAEKCFTSAYKYGDVEGTALWLLAKLYETENQKERAARAYEGYLRAYDDIKTTDDNVTYCLQFLAKHYCEKADFDKATAFAQRCLEHDSVCEDGRFVLRTISSTKAAVTTNTTGRGEDAFRTPGRGGLSDETIATPGISEAGEADMAISDGEEDESF